MALQFERVKVLTASGGDNPRRQKRVLDKPWRALLFCCLLTLLTIPASLFAQGAEPITQEIFAGSDAEEYLRVLQDLGKVEPYTWSLRPFSPRELDRMIPDDLQHPWAERFDLSRDSAKGPHFRWIAPRFQGIYNSALPFGSNDGAVWAGKGITTAAQAGIWARWGPVSLRVAPTFFRAENESFELREGEIPDELEEFVDPAYPIYIDLPQRFGEDPYSRVDPGESVLRVDLPVVSFGFSTANQFWGPASDHPMVLSNNAGGFPHGFVGTSGPQNIWIGRVHARLMWGDLDQTAYSPMPDSLSRRFATGVVASFSPRFLSDFEIGGTRFFHNTWPRDGLRASDFLQPFESFLKIGLDLQESQSDTLTDELRRSSPDNQIASIFARWNFPDHGIEVYGEYAREDHNYDFRDLILELTHNSGYMFGLRKAWEMDSGSLLALRGEVINTRPGVTSRARTIPQYPFYLHGSTRQGHTQRGQILGSSAGYGGAGSVLSVDHYHEGGRWSVTWSRNEVNERDRNWTDKEEEGERLIDVIQALGGEAVFFGRYFDVSIGTTAAYEFNRNFRDDVFNLNASVGLRARF